MDCICILKILHWHCALHLLLNIECSFFERYFERTQNKSVIFALTYRVYAQRPQCTMFDQKIYCNILCRPAWSWWSTLHIHKYSDLSSLQYIGRWNWVSLEHTQKNDTGGFFWGGDLWMWCEVERYCGRGIIYDLWVEQ